MESETNEQIAKTNPREIAASDSTDTTDTMSEERPELPEDMEQTGGPMGGGFPGQMTTGKVANTTNEWLIPMTATGIISGTMILATIAICLTIFFTRKKH